jgi:hypothetical protein
MIKVTEIKTGIQMHNSMALEELQKGGIRKSIVIKDLIPQDAFDKIGKYVVTVEFVEGV